MADVWAIVLAAGGGTRFGDLKQFAQLDGRTVIHRSIETARAAGCKVVAVVPADVADRPRRDADATVAGGATRSQSVRAGLAAVPADAEIIVVHDAARPLASLDLWRRVIDGACDGPVAVPVVPIVDSIREYDRRAADRGDFVAVQTPQAFDARRLRQLHSSEPECSDDAGLVEYVVHVAGEPSNIKITHPFDLEVARRDPEVVVQVTFVYNPTSWNPDTDAPWPGGMADALVRPVVAHMADREYRIARWPAADTVNVYYTHRGVQGVAEEPGPCSVFVSHGIADKAWRNFDRMRNRWDFVFVSGPAWTIKLINQGLEPERIVEVGYAKLDPLFDGVRADRPDERIRVLWAPTHGGGGERAGQRAAGRRARTSHHHGAAILAELPADRFDVRVARHPRHREDRRATLDEYRDCDVVIADGGSTIYEAWALDLPVVFPSWLTGQANMLRAERLWTFEAELYKERIGRHATRPEVLAAQVTAAAEDGITLEEQRYVEDILPRSYRGTSGAMHAEALRQIAAGEFPDRCAKPLRPIRYRSRQGFEYEVMPGTSEQMKFERSARWTRVDEEVTV